MQILHKNHTRSQAVARYRVGLADRTAAQQCRLVIVAIYSISSCFLDIAL